MNLDTDRIAGLFIAGLGLALLLVVFPIQIEAGDGGSIDPNTVPNAIAAFLVVCGILLAIKKGEQTKRDVKELMLVLLYLAIIAASLFAISYFGFLVVSLPGVSNYADLWRTTSLLAGVRLFGNASSYLVFGNTRSRALATLRLIDG